MAPTPRSSHSLGEAGLHSDETAVRERGRRYFTVVDTLSGIKGHQTDILQPEDHVPNAFCKDTSARSREAGDDYCGMSSLELSKVKDSNHRRGKRLICVGMSKSMMCRTPSEPSVASEPISLESAMEHLGHREKVKDDRFTKEMLEAAFVEEEPMCGVTTHHLHHRNMGGFGRRHFSSERQGYHRSLGINDPGGQTTFEMKNRSWIGPRKGCAGKNTFQSDHFMTDIIEAVEKKEHHGKKLYLEKLDVPVHATEDVPLGVSTQIDLDTCGFLGKSKHNFGGQMQISSDPITDCAHVPHDETDPTYTLAAYGLGHRGKRKFLTPTSLSMGGGCTHNMEPQQGITCLTMKLDRSLSAPVLECPKFENKSPFFQDDLPEAERASIKEQVPSCRTHKEMDRHVRPRSAVPQRDSSWSCLTWTPRKVDDNTATKFVEGQDSEFYVADQQHASQECRAAMGNKRSFGNAHNKSQFMFDYYDPPEYKTQHYVVVAQHSAKDTYDDKLKEDRTLFFGSGRGRRKFDIRDHLDKDADGVECYRSSNGAVLGKVAHVDVKDHVDPVRGEHEASENFLRNQFGEVLKTRSHKTLTDNVDELMNCEVRSENSNTLGLAGSRRKSELIRPLSARRFPQKDFEKKTPRSVTPRPASKSKIPISERPRWSG